ncbi:MAG: hypothetical protein D6681_14440 [Calditrichaeota bacterium]|nr:MAG: hypothetical protein D6681_14440 [Calditrichota bacterium]
MSFGSVPPVSPEAGLGDANQMRGKTEAQLKKEYALPKDGQYDYVTDYKGAKDRPAMVGRTGANEWGPGGNTQVKLVGKKDLDPKKDFYPNSSTPVKKP